MQFCKSFLWNWVRRPTHGLNYDLWPCKTSIILEWIFQLYWNQSVTDENDSAIRQLSFLELFSGYQDTRITANLAVSFQIVIMAAIRDSSYGGIAIDSIRLSPDCRKASGNTLIPVFKSIILVLVLALSIGPFLSPFVPLKQKITL